MRQRLVSAIILVALIILTTLFLAPYANPDFSLLYKVRRAEEKIIEITKIKPEAKADYDIQLLQNRLNDLFYVADHKEYPLFVSTSLRYAATAGKLTELIKSKSLNAKKNQAIKLFEKHKRLIQQTLSKTGTNDDWKFIHDDINYLTIYEKVLQDFPSH